VDGTPVGRRVVLGMLGTAVAGILWGRRAQDALERVVRPVADAAGAGVSGLLPAGRFRIYSVTGSLPHRTAAAYRLRVTGLVGSPISLGIDELRAMTPTALTRDFQCVTGWRVHNVAWRGVRLADLLDAAGVLPGARAVTFRSFDGTYTESLTLDQARRPDVIVAYEMQGRPLSREHGGPARLYVAPMYGYKSCKWLEEIAVVGRLEPGYWERRGYDQHAWIGRSNGRDDPPV
jgi:DMSO/TMAO reductase YedYZ molybdopterin-dependent catalytic subunit